MGALAVVELNYKCGDNSSKVPRILIPAFRTKGTQAVELPLVRHRVEFPVGADRGVAASHAEKARVFQFVEGFQPNARHDVVPLGKQPSVELLAARVAVPFKPLNEPTAVGKNIQGQFCAVAEFGKVAHRGRSG